MSTVTRWLRQPQRVWLRRAIFQIHLWTGLAIGLYVVVLSLTGSVLVYRAEVNRFLASPRATFDERATPMTVDQLRVAAERAYRDGPSPTSRRADTKHVPVPVMGAAARRPPDPTASIALERDDQKKERLFNPYTGSDLGDYITPGERWLIWLTRLHDNMFSSAPKVPGGMGCSVWSSL